MTAAKNARTAALEALIDAHAVDLKLPTVRRRFRTMAEEAVREQQTPIAYLAALLEAEMAERAERREKRRLIDARFPAMKRLEDFRFADNSKVPQATIAALAEGSWIDDRESVISSVTLALARRCWPQRSGSVPANKADASASPPSPPWPTSYRRPPATKSSPESSAATPGPSWSS
jgi:hypothetical protein